eukprot:248616_1
MSTALTAEKLRQKQKAAYARTFNEITNSSTFKSIQNKLGLDKYKFSLMSEAYKFQLIDFVCYNYAIGHSRIANIFQLNVFDRYNDFGQDNVNHFLKTGLMIIVIDKNNSIVGCGADIDLFDRPHKNNKSMPLKLLHKIELTSYAPKMYSE